MKKLNLVYVIKFGFIYLICFVDAFMKQIVLKDVVC
jgi:hypothetical protein